MYFIDELENKVDYIKEDTKNLKAYKRELLSRAMPVTECYKLNESITERLGTLKRGEYCLPSVRVYSGSF